ncbi:MAG: DHHA1 domain-containing protein, partial [Verrucomicrobiota bacterium]|nr:DHHA1 domain-containing protein [Verrucomicrobiota bacterium]
MGGQEGDKGTAIIRGQSYPITAVQKIGHATAHIISEVDHRSLSQGDSLQISIDRTHRASIEAHHTATHLLHWALHEVISSDASQQGSSVSTARLRFDFNSKALSKEQLRTVESMVNERIKQGDDVSWQKKSYNDVKGRQDIMQFFGDKYGHQVRVVQIGGEPNALNGYSMELCGGTHVKNTAEIGLFKIKSETAIASGVRRIEAVCGAEAEYYIADQEIKESAAKTAHLNRLKLLNAELSKLEEATFTVNPTANAEQIKITSIEASKSLKKAQAAGAAKIARSLLEAHDTSTNCVIAVEGSAALLQELLITLKKEQFEHAAFIIINDNDKLLLGAICGPLAQSNNIMAGQLLQSLAPLAGGKGGGKPDMARGAAPDITKFFALKKAAHNKLS